MPNAKLLLRLATVSLFLMSNIVPVQAEEGTDARQVVRDAEISLQHFMSDPEMERFRVVAKHAKGLFIAPEVWEAGVGIGGSLGKGILFIRDKESGQWRGPAFYTLGSATLGLQLGVQKSEVILLVMNQSGVNAMLSSGLKLGVGASVAAGLIGKGAAVTTADILSYSRAKGVFGGVSLNGEVLAVNMDLNKDYYGRSSDSVDILIRGDLTNDQSIPLLSLVNDATGG